MIEGFRTAAWLEHNQCDVVVVDLKMPKVDGISLISYIREMSDTLPIAVFTVQDTMKTGCTLRSARGRQRIREQEFADRAAYCVLSRVLATCHQRTRCERLHRPTEQVLAGTA